MNIQQWIQSNRKLTLLIGIVIIAALSITLLLTQTKKQREIDEVAEVVSIALGQDEINFAVTETLVDTGNWKMLRITSTNAADRGNDGFVIVYQDDEETTLKVGPGTYFSPEVMRDAGVPSNVQNEIINRQ